LTDSWTVSGDDRYDYLKIGLSQRLPYISRYEIHPARIVIDIFGAVSNTNWITQLTSAKEIKNVWYEQPEKNVVRVTVELKHHQAWGYTVYYERSRLVIRVKQQPEILSLRNITIGLDAGHGGSNIGALGSTGAQEKDINLAIVVKLKAALEKLGAKTILTRQGDETLSTTARWQIWHKAEPDIVLSMHNNSIGNSDPMLIKGTSTYYKYIAFRPLTEILYDEMLKTGLSEFGNVGSFNFLLNAPTEFPNALIEVAFMSNPEDEMKLLDPAFQDRIVKGVVSGLERFLKKCK
jgi:N-acetylmuramoyl-L-alanine amidase